MMTASEMVRAALTKTGTTHQKLAEHMGWSRQNLSNRLKINSLTFDELAKALAFCGYTVKIVDSADEEIPPMNNSSSPRVTQIVDGVSYDTSKSESLCSSKGAPSESLYMELFKDASGAYFLAYYQLWEGGHNQITPVSENAAMRFYRLYSASR